MKPCFLFATGAPGSAWSMITQTIKMVVPGFDRSDELQNGGPGQIHTLPLQVRDRFLNVPKNWQMQTHHGVYFGPYHQYGRHFEHLNYYTDVDDFFNECMLPFRDNEKPLKLIKSHWFAYNLDWLWENCKGHEILLINRDPDCSFNWWHDMGGWNIKHPTYTWYENDIRLMDKIKEEVRLVDDFGKKHNVEWCEWDSSRAYVEKLYDQKPGKFQQATMNIDDTILISRVRIT